MSVALARLDFGFPQPGPPLERELERASLVGFDSPSEFSVGAPPDSALAVFPPAFADGSGPPLLEFPVPTAFQSQVPRSTASGEADRGRRELPRSRRCRPRALSAPRRFELLDPHEPELPRARTNRAFPKTCAALFRAADALGIFPTELSPLEEPCRLSTAVCSLAGSATRHRTPARRRQGSRDRFHLGAAPEPHPQTPERARRHDGEDGT